MNNQEIKIGSCYMSLCPGELYKTSYGADTFRQLEFHEIIFVLGIENYMVNDLLYNVKVLTADGFVGYITVLKKDWSCYVESTDR